MNRLRITLLLLLLPTMLFAQLDSIRLDKNYIKKYWTDTKEIVSSPIRWKGKDWLKFAAFSGVTVGMFYIDEPIRDGFQELRSDEMDWVTKNFFEPFDIPYSIVICGSFSMYGVLAKDSKSLSTGLLALESYMLSGLLARVPKKMIGRKRPDAWDNPNAFDFNGPGIGQSFPSGHTTAAFSIATVIATQYADTKWVPVLSYSVATCVGLSRVYDNKHWFSDVVGGAVIGILVGKLVTKDNIRERITLVPFTTGELKGLKLALTL